MPNAHTQWNILLIISYSGQIDCSTLYNAVVILRPYGRNLSPSGFRLDVMYTFCTTWSALFDHSPLPPDNHRSSSASTDTAESCELIQLIFLIDMISACFAFAFAHHLRTTARHEFLITISSNRVHITKYVSINYNTKIVAAKYSIEHVIPEQVSIVMFAMGTALSIVPSS